VRGKVAQFLLLNSDFLLAAVSSDRRNVEKMIATLSLLLVGIGNVRLEDLPPAVVQLRPFFSAESGAATAARRVDRAQMNCTDAS
jgi:hypothetical protein